MKTLVSFPTIDVCDPGHPEAMDWRRVTPTLSATQPPSVNHTHTLYLAFTLRRKAGGRHVADLFECKAWEGSLDRLTCLLLAPLGFAPGDLTRGGSRGCSNIDRRSPTLSYTLPNHLIDAYRLLTGHGQAELWALGQRIQEKEARRKLQSIR